ncbi:MAG: hypothetical protein PUG50_01805 [Eubacteriales bacterium]|uniref:hypothetical protein n=1 Tax=Fenollaria sp. TaxID=1965292 RepID=UPI002A7641C5|nr:hypothetical protein [Fenollaria sp.]MDD7339303.1 hypothetical protein [Eubacteriales bacterium]MDY3105884.1 hypothetical protein [Fenollaria sp.]
MDKTRKRILRIVGALILVLILAFFTNKRVIYRYMPNSTVNETVNKMKESSKTMDGDDGGATSPDQESETSDELSNSENESNSENGSTSENESNSENESSNANGQSYDLTANDADMNYVIVAMIAEDPKSFEGVKIKLQGIATDLETTDTSGIDHYVLINDRQACCQQGLQYILEDKNQNYPKDKEEITVEGVLDVYNSPDIPFPLPIIRQARLISR